MVGRDALRDRRRNLPFFSLLFPEACLCHPPRTPCAEQRRLFASDAHRSFNTQIDADVCPVRTDFEDKGSWVEVRDFRSKRIYDATPGRHLRPGRFHRAVLVSRRTRASSERFVRCRDFSCAPGLKCPALHSSHNLCRVDISILHMRWRRSAALLLLRAGQHEERQLEVLLGFLDRKAGQQHAQRSLCPLISSPLAWLDVILGNSHQQALEDIDGLGSAGVSKREREAPCDDLNASSGAKALRRVATGDEQRERPQGDGSTENGFKPCWRVGLA
ncbi:hypothetical protein [Methylocella silvestris]|uniref:hypothetical protein n=1 Tax=Methylocella silvestris TaxID=199596 RepID=UPI00164F6B58|nr:hypothetical protein [Methylocella silvestris]